MAKTKFKVEATVIDGDTQAGIAAGFPELDTATAGALTGAVATLLKAGVVPESDAYSVSVTAEPGSYAVKVAAA